MLQIYNIENNKANNKEDIIFWFLVPKFVTNWNLRNRIEMGIEFRILAYTVYNW